MKRPCLGCGRLIGKGSRCRRCESKRERRTPGRGSGAQQRRFRAAVLAKTGGRCAVCGTTRNVEAHHGIPLVAGGSNDPAAGVPLCRRCHRRMEGDDA